MDIIQNIGSYIILEMFTWQVFAFIAIGTLIGLTLGSIPGISSSLGVGLVLPFTFYLPVLESMGLLIGIYKAAIIGGAISAISFGTPGTPSASAIKDDGFALTQKGQSKKALHMNLYSSIAADTGSDLVLLFLIGPLAFLALLFGPIELFAVMFLSLSMIVIFARENPFRGTIAAFVGLLIGVIGTDPITGISRFTFGIGVLRDGVHSIPYIIGLLAFSEVLLQARKAIGGLSNPEIITSKKRIFDEEGLTLKEFLSCKKEIFIGWVSGTFLGMLPGLGATVAAFTSYGISKRFSKNSENFGSGALEGVAAATAGDSATSGSSFIPMFSFGIPGSGTAALFMGALMLQGIQPGPYLMRESPEILYTILVMIIIANMVVFILGRLMTPLFTFLAYLPTNILVPCLGVVCTMGIYSIHSSVFQVITLVAMGLIGYFFRAYKFPLQGAIIGFILARSLEGNFRRALLIGGGNYLHLFSSRTGNIIYLFTLVLIIIIIFLKDKQKVTKPNLL